MQVVAAAPVRHVPDALVMALQGSWGAPVGADVRDERQVLTLAR